MKRIEWKTQEVFNPLISFSIRVASFCDSVEPLECVVVSFSGGEPNLSDLDARFICGIIRFALETNNGIQGVVIDLSQFVYHSGDGMEDVVQCAMRSEHGLLASIFSTGSSKVIERPALVVSSLCEEGVLEIVSGLSISVHSKIEDALQYLYENG